MLFQYEESKTRYIDHSSLRHHSYMTDSGQLCPFVSFEPTHAGTQTISGQGNLTHAVAYDLRYKPVELVP